MKKLTFALTVLAVSTARAGVVIHVDDDNCPGPGDGSESDPYCSIQTAIVDAVDTDEIVVAPGTYFESINFLGKAVTLRSTDPTDPDVVANTIIDGAGFLHVVQCVSGEGADTVLDGFTVTGGNANGGAFLDRYGGGMLNNGGSPTVTNCTFEGNSATSLGGGMLNRHGSSPTVINCAFSGNSGGNGGGMYNLHVSPTVTGCTFSDNSAAFGGGMYNNGGSPTVTNCTFDGNTAISSGGGGMLNSGSSPTVNSCIFSGNMADGGGGMQNAGGSPTVINCTFSGNLAVGNTLGGGGMVNGANALIIGCLFLGNTSNYVGGGMSNFNSSPTVTDCIFADNSANVDGGGMYNVLGSPTVNSCTFNGNTTFLGHGGGMYSNDSSPTVTGCVFSNNSAGFCTPPPVVVCFGFGGGMYNRSSSPAVFNSSFSGNFAGDDGGGMYNDNSNLTAKNCIFWGDSSEEIIVLLGTTTVTYSDVQGGFPGTGNIDGDPLFVDPDNGDLRLQAGSPCIDAGDNTAVTEGITTDLDGNPRFLDVPETPDTGNGTLPIVDMGAYESLGGGCLAVTSQEIVCHADGTTFTVNIDGLNACTGGTTQVTFTASGGAVGEAMCFTAVINDGGFCCSTEICVTIPDCTPAALPSDLDGDGTVGIGDFLAMLKAWGSCSECATPAACPADLDGDCSVGINDLLILLADWG